MSIAAGERQRVVGLFLFAICGLIGVSSAVAQGVRGAIDVRVETTDGTPPAGAVVEILAASGSGSVAEARVPADTPTVSLPAPLATMVVRVSLSGFLAAERPVAVRPGEVVSLIARLGRTGGGTASTLADADRYAAPRDTTFDRRALESLPSASTVSSLLETSHPFVIADRIDGGGQWPGDAIRLGGQHGGPASQALFRLDGVDVTDPRLVGAPPSDVALPMLETVVVQSASLDASAPGPGPVVDLVVRRPSATWSGEARFAIAPDGLQSPAGDVAPVTRLVSGRDGDLSAGGPLGGSRLGLFVSGRAASASRVERDSPIALEPAGGSAMAHLVFTPTADAEWRTVATFDNADRPLTARARFADRDVMQRDRSAMLHTTWEARRGGSLWTIGAAWQRATTDAGVAANARGGVVERLLDGAPLDLVAPADATRTRWDVQIGVAPATRRWLGRDHDLRLGASIGGGALTSRAGPQPAFAEVVGGRPARVWDVAVSGESSRRSVLAASAFVSDRVVLSDRFTLLAALRAESDRGSAEGGTGSIGWFTVTPRVSLRWRAAERLSITTGYAWYGHRLPLSHLAVADPSGPAGVMYRWDDRDQNGTFTPSELTAVAAIGSNSRIDADLRRPTMSEFRIGFEYGIGAWRWGITGLDRRQRHLPALVNVGVTPADYSVRYIDDPGIDVEGRSGFEPLPIFDRRPESFMRDAYVLTNTPAEPAVYQGFEVTLDREVGNRWFFRFGGSAYLSDGVGVNRGYRADENEHGGLGEVFMTPNATTNARGRLFSDRAFVMKVLGSHTGPGPLVASFVARYQDGQPFARLVVAEGLAQGVEVVQAYPRGGQRFHYTLTLDARAELRWKVGRRGAVGVALEVFNLPNLAQETEEDIVTGPAFRTITAVQPPRVVRVGLRLGF